MWGLVGKSDYMIDDPPTRGSAVLENQILIVPRDLYLLERIEEFLGTSTSDYRNRGFR